MVGVSVPEDSHVEVTFHSVYCSHLTASSRGVSYSALVLVGIMANRITISSTSKIDH